MNSLTSTLLQIEHFLTKGIGETVRIKHTSREPLKTPHILVRYLLIYDPT